jgi:predicted nucleotidyltransferase
VKRGDTVRIECRWDRSQRPLDTPRYIVFAEGTEDEMCFSTYTVLPTVKP